MAPRAPVGGAVGVALAAGEDSGAADWARLAGAAVDGVGVTAVLDRVLHQVVGGIDDSVKLLVGQIADLLPGI